MIRTRAQFINYFRSDVMPAIHRIELRQGGRPDPDYPLRAETWNNLVDSMITDRQLPRCASRWDNPFTR